MEFVNDGFRGSAATGVIFWFAGLGAPAAAVNNTSRPLSSNPF